jgi:hypothetical protein
MFNRRVQGSEKEMELEISRIVSVAACHLVLAPVATRVLGGVWPLAKREASPSPVSTLNTSSSHLSVRLSNAADQILAVPASPTWPVSPPVHKKEAGFI